MFAVLLKVDGDDYAVMIRQFLARSICGHGRVLDSGRDDDPAVSQARPCSVGVRAGLPTPQRVYPALRPRTRGVLPTKKRGSWQGEMGLLSSRGGAAVEKMICWDLVPWNGTSVMETDNADPTAMP